jgi:hypothetical protein
MKFIALSLMAYGLSPALIKSVTTSIILRNVDGFSDNHNYQVCLAQNSNIIGRMGSTLTVGFRLGRAGEFNSRFSISPLQSL